MLKLPKFKPSLKIMSRTIEWNQRSDRNRNFNKMWQTEPIGCRTQCTLYKKIALIKFCKQWDHTGWTTLQQGTTVHSVVQQSSSIGFEFHLRNEKILTVNYQGVRQLSRNTATSYERLEWRECGNYVASTITLKPTFTATSKNWFPN